MILAFQIVRRYTKYTIRDEALQMLRQIVTVSLLVNLFLLGCEVFKEFYSDSVHTSAARYLLFGLHGHDALVPWIWSAIAAEIVAAFILIVPPLARKMSLLNAACILSFLGIWIEKGHGADCSRFFTDPAGGNCRVFPYCAGNPHHDRHLGFQRADRLMAAASGATHTVRHSAAYCCGCTEPATA